MCTNGYLQKKDRAGQLEKLLQLCSEDTNIFTDAEKQEIKNEIAHIRKQYNDTPGLVLLDMYTHTEELVHKIEAMLNKDM